MPDKKSSKENTKKEVNWRDHDIYSPGVSSNRIVTRSQSAFVRINNSESDLELFCDKRKFHPPGMKHLMVTLVGEYGAVPRTIITRSTGEHLSINKDLCNQLDKYKKYKPSDKDTNSKRAQG